MTATEGGRPTAADVAHLKAGDEVDATFRYCAGDTPFRIIGVAEVVDREWLEVGGHALRGQEGRPGRFLMAVNSPLPPPPPARPDGWYVLTNSVDGEAFALRSEAGEWVDGYGQVERFVAGCSVGPRLVGLGPDDLVVNVPEGVRDDLIRFLRWRHSHRRGAFWAGSSMGEVTLAVARAVADARGIPHAGQGATS